MLCDIFVLYVLQKRLYYRNRKYDVVTDDTVEIQVSLSFNIAGVWFCFVELFYRSVRFTTGE